MRFMMLVKATPETEAGVPPSKEMISEMRRYNQELARAGALVALDGLHPSGKGFRVNFSRNDRNSAGGPIADTRVLVSRYWVIQVKSREEAIEWARRIPDPTGQHGDVEVRQVFDGSDFPPEVLRPEDAIREQTLLDGLRKQAARRHSRKHGLTGVSTLRGTDAADQDLVQPGLRRTRRPLRRIVDNRRRPVTVTPPAASCRMEAVGGVL